MMFIHEGFVLLLIPACIQRFNVSMLTIWHQTIQRCSNSMPFVWVYIYICTSIHVTAAGLTLQAAVLASGNIGEAIHEIGEELRFHHLIKPVVNIRMA